ncbi:MAG TPA: 50S ribosomal protein L31 [Vitreimonas sp.]|nr:50S ribosomal protein L31 [Vitreimonas sp.]
MKSGIHPQWYHDAVVTCACGNTFTTGSILQAVQIDICNKCHPFFTGEVRFVDRQGRVDRFMQKMQTAQQKQAAAVQKKGKNKKADAPQEDPKSYQEILRTQQSKLRKDKTAPAA